MPTYQYSCTECGHFFEQFQSFSDASLTTCPECEGRLRKVFNAVGVVFKGSGFYRTDSRAANGSGDSSGKSGDGTSGTGESSGAKTDGAGTKSDTKSDTKSGGDKGSSTSGGTSGTKAGSAA